MNIRLMPYQEVFIVLTMSSKEADLLAEALDDKSASAGQSPVADFARDLQDGLMASVTRAKAYQERKDELLTSSKSGARVGSEGKS